MDLSKMRPAKGSTRDNKRLGRGQGSGMGGTSTRGHKGAKSRSGYSQKIGFEGGQMPLQRIVPKSGFKNRNRIEFKAINLEVLQRLSETLDVLVIDMEVLVNSGIVSKNEKIKVLGKGVLTNRLTVKAHAFSKSAKEAIEKLEGTTEIL